MKRTTISATQSAAFDQWIAKLALEQLVEDIADKQLPADDSGRLEQRLIRLLEDAEAPEGALAVDLTEDKQAHTDDDPISAFSLMIERLALEQMVEDIELQATDGLDEIGSDRRSALLEEFLIDTIGGSKER